MRGVKCICCICPDTRVASFCIMADIGYRLMQTVTSTLCEQCGPAIGEPQATPTNSHYQFGAQMAGGTLHWQAAGNGGPLTVTFVPAPSSSTTPPPPVAPIPLSLPPIEDRSEVTSLPIPPLNPFPGPIIPGIAPGEAPQFVPNQSPHLGSPAINHYGSRRAQTPRWPPRRPPVWNNRPLDMG